MSNVGITKFSDELWNEEGYLTLVKRTIDCGKERNDRTGVGTRALFGSRLKFDLSNRQFPLLTTKQMPFRTILNELFFFIRGQTDNDILNKNKVRIWDANSTREYLDTRGLSERRVGDLGPIYGFQWRHFGASYNSCTDDYSGQGVDQLSQVLHSLKTDPTSRRHLVSAWNPSDIDKMVLPPCHVSFQFFVDTEFNRLDCQLYQRSADLGLGVPFNIASYAALTYMVARVVGLVPGVLTMVFGDTHVYENHIQALTEQIERPVLNPPKLTIALGSLVVEKIEDLLNLDYFVLDDYRPAKAIQMQMAV